jgi:hypothetical protein
LLFAALRPELRGAGDQTTDLPVESGASISLMQSKNGRMLLYVRF